MCREDNTTTIPELVLRGLIKGSFRLLLSSFYSLQKTDRGVSPVAGQKERERERTRKEKSNTGTTAGKTEEAEWTSLPLRKKNWTKMQEFLKRQTISGIRGLWEAKTQVRSGADP